MKNIIRVLFLLLSTTLFVVACFSPWAGDEELGTVTINLSTTQRAVWSDLSDIMPLLTHVVTLKRNGSVIGTINVPREQSSAQAQVTPGPLDVEVRAYFNGWDFAEGFSASTVTVVARRTTKVDPIEMQRMSSGIVMDIEKASLLDSAVFEGQDFSKTITVSNYSESETSITFNITGPADTPFLTISPSPSFTIDKDTSQEFIFASASGAPGFQLSDLPYKYVIQIQDGVKVYNAFNAEITVCEKTSAGIQTMVDKTTSGVIELIAGNYEMDSTVIISKDITLTTQNNTYPKFGRKGSFVDSLFKVIAGRLNLKSYDGDTSASSSITLDGTLDDSLNPPVTVNRSLITVENSGSLEMNGNVNLSYNKGVIENGGAVNKSGSGSFTMNGGTINGNEAQNGGGVYISGGTFTMTDGVIHSNKATDFGGGVYISGGTFIKEAGSSPLVSIYGSDDASFANTAGDGTENHKGHAVYYVPGSHWRDSSLYVTDYFATDDENNLLWDD
jgi:hypothetical protein